MNRATFTDDNNCHYNKKNIPLPVATSVMKICRDIKVEVALEGKGYQTNNLETAL